MPPHAGPIQLMPTIVGSTVLLNDADYDKLETAVKKRRN